MGSEDQNKAPKLKSPADEIMRTIKSLNPFFPQQVSNIIPFILSLSRSVSLSPRIEFICSFRVIYVCHELSL